jgi:hypothetical protein
MRDAIGGLAVLGTSLGANAKQSFPSAKELVEAHQEGTRARTYAAASAPARRVEVVCAARPRVEAGDEVARRARVYQDSHPGAKYSDAIIKVCADDPALAGAYLGLPTEGEAESAVVRAEVDRRVQQVRAARPALSYVAAREVVFADDPQLKTRYAQS